MILGIFGMIGSGKSTFAQQKKLQEPKKNWYILELDHVGHVLLQESAIIEQIQKEFSQDNISIDGKISRQKLRDIVFSHEEKLEKLEEILHPKMKKVVEKVCTHARKNTQNVLLVAALAYKFDLQQYCDEVILLKITKQQAWQRIRQF